MARTSARNVNPSLSSDPRDKLLAALNWSWEAEAQRPLRPGANVFRRLPGMARAAVAGSAGNLPHTCRHIGERAQARR